MARCGCGFNHAGKRTSWCKVHSGQAGAAAANRSKRRAAKTTVRRTR